MCNFCEGKDKLESIYCDIGIEKNVPFYGTALVVQNIRKSCPNYSDCCSKDMIIQVDFKIKYCPMCGNKIQ